MRIDRHAPNRFSPAPDSASYRARSGDTLRRIAERLGIRLADLAAANPHIGSADAPLRPGQVLQLPAPGAPSAASRHAAPTSFRVEYERARPNVFQRLAEPSLFGPSPDVDVSGAGLGGGGGKAWAAPDPWLTALEKTLSQEASALKLIKALKDFLMAVEVVRDPNALSTADQASLDAAARVGPMFRKLCEEAINARVQGSLPARIDALTKFIQGVDGNYRRFRETFRLPPDMATGLAVAMTAFQQHGNRVLMELLKGAYPAYFARVGSNPLDWLQAVVGFTERVCGVQLPQTFKDLFKVLKYLPSSAVASLVGDGVKLFGDVLVALYRSAMGDARMWDEIITGMLHQDYGPAFQGFAFLADFVITGGRNIEKVPMDKILFADLFDAGPVFRATPQLDRFLRTLREPAFLDGLYRTGQLDPAAVAGQLFTDVEQNGTRLNFVRRLESALDAIVSEVQTGRRSYAEWAAFREVVGAVVAEVLRRVDRLGPAWTARFRQAVDPDALRRLYRRLNDPAVDRDLQTWADLHGTALNFLRR